MKNVDVIRIDEIGKKAGLSQVGQAEFLRWALGVNNLGTSRPRGFVIQKHREVILFTHEDYQTRDNPDGLAANLPGEGMPPKGSKTLQKHQLQSLKIIKRFKGSAEHAPAKKEKLQRREPAALSHKKRQGQVSAPGRD